MNCEVRYDGEGRYEIHFPYDETLLAIVRRLPNRRYHPKNKYWSVPEESVVATVEALKPHEFSFDEHTMQKYEQCLTERKDSRSRGRESDYTVLRLNQEVHEVLRGAFPSNIWLVGEVSDVTDRTSTPHMFFQLVQKDDTGDLLAAVDAVIYRDNRIYIEKKLEQEGNPFRFEDGLTIRVNVQVGLYERTGKYQVIIQDLDVEYTLGEVARRREQIIRQLSSEGILDRNRQLSFPCLPLRVGVITSLASQARMDIEKTIGDSGFSFRLVFHDARMQGKETGASVLNALERVKKNAGVFDVIMICRGGGARTDLAWFDNVSLGRAVALFPLPVMVGIGHEPDQTVLDAVGWSFKTPTACAEHLVTKVSNALSAVENRTVTLLGLTADKIDEGKGINLNRSKRLSLAASQVIALHQEKLTTRRFRTADLATGRLKVAEDALRGYGVRMPQSVGIQIGAKRAFLAGSTRSLVQGAGRGVNAANSRMEDVIGSLLVVNSRFLVREKERTDSREKRLFQLDPRRTLERGYAILRLASGKVVTDQRMAPVSAIVHAELKKGALRLRSEGPDMNTEGGNEDGSAG